jgi:Glycosyl transferases group 1
VRVAVVTEFGAWSASTRYRALQHVPGLRSLLGHVDVFAPDDQPLRAPGRSGQARYFASHGFRYLRRWRELAGALPEYDAVFVQRGAYALGPGAVVRPLERFKGRVVFDLDDAVFSPHPSLQVRSAPVRWLYGPQQALRILRRADAVVASTPALASELRRYGSEAVVLPTVPDPSKYAVANHAPEIRTIGWAGTNGGLSYLDPLRGVFEDLRDRGIGELEVVSSVTWDGPCRFRRWRIEEESTLFARFAVGIMPLPDSRYTRSKAGFKLLQYMAAGIPVIASPVGINVELVERSGGGLLADSLAEWSEALELLLGNVDLRREMGRRGRSFVETYADVGAQSATLAALLAGVPPHPSYGAC